MEYTILELEKWDEIIRKIAKDGGLDCYLQEFEICSYEDMLCYEAYMGMPSHYPHWSYGKAYERKKTLYSYNVQGLPYEIVINSNPCLAYLMRDNTLLLQILTIAHVYGHNDFFKNNRIFKSGIDVQTTIGKFKNHADRIREYIYDPSIGYEKVEKILDAAHGIRFQTYKDIGVKKISEVEKKQKLIDNYYAQIKRESILDEKKYIPFPDINKIPVELTECLLNFLIEFGNLEDWEKDILRIVEEETEYFIPQIETKVLNEGWASYWHYKILNKMQLPENLHLEFLNRHNQVIRPIVGSINPYYVGFKMLLNIEEKYGKEKLFEIRSLERDASFIRRYLTEELCVEMNLFQYGKSGRDFIIQEVSDEAGWKEVRNTLSNNVGMGAFPVIKVQEVLKKDNTLLLVHEYDGRELELSYAQETLKHLSNLWRGAVQLETVLNNYKKIITCDENKKLTMKDAGPFKSIN